MAQKVLSFPFQFDTNNPGSLKLVEQESDSYKAQQLEAFLRTQKGERPIFKDFGVEDPSFAVVSDDYAENFDLMAEFASFYTNIAIDDVVVQVEDDGSISVEVYYT